MSKEDYRSFIDAEWRLKQANLARNGHVLAYRSQRNAAMGIFDKFLEGCLIVTFIASPQWGKTGAALYLIYLMTTHMDVNIMIHPKNVYIITGMSDKDWVAQTKKRMLSSFKKRVFHRNKLHEIVQKIINKRDILIIVDECHYGGEKGQTIHVQLQNMGIMDINYMREKNIKILFISATPGAHLFDANAWGTENHAKIVEVNNDGYTNFDHLIEEDRIFKTINFGNRDEIDIFLNHTDIWDTPKYHIIRVYDKKSVILKEAILERGFDYEEHNSADRINDIDEVLNTEPRNHKFILIKNFWRAAKTLNDIHIGICYDSSKDYTAVVQGLGGRLLGYNRRRGPTAPRLFTDVSVIREYQKFLINNATYTEYKSVKLQVRDGILTKKIDTNIHPDGVIGLTVDLDALHVNIVPPKIRKEKVLVESVPVNGLLVTEYKSYSEEQFLKQFGLKSLPETAVKLTNALKARFKIRSSFKESSIQSLSNFNTYGKKTWFDGEYNIIKHPDWIDRIVVIKRNIDALKNLQDGDEYYAHDFEKNLYKWVR